jgi:hypothetical protein
MTSKFEYRPCAARLRQRILAVYSDALIAWSHGEPIDTAAVHREIDALINEAFAEQAKRSGDSVTSEPVTETDCAAGDAISRLVSAQYELELAARVPGEIVEIRRQDVDGVIDDLRAAARVIRGIAERAAYGPRSR